MAQRETAHRIRRFVLLGTVIGVVIGTLIFVLKIAVQNSFDYSKHWAWALTIVLGGVAGAAIGLVASALGQPEED